MKDWILTKQLLFTAALAASFLSHQEGSKPALERK
jgi:hypothetical protein